MKKLWMILLVVLLLTSCAGYTQTPTCQFGGFQYKEIEDFSPFDSAPFLTPYQDSIIKLSLDYLDDYQARRKDKLGGIEKYWVLKHETRDSIEAIVYEDKRYNDAFNSGVFVAYSSNHGSTWDYYYTGLTQDAPMFVKWYSKYPLIDSEGNVQIEACQRSGDGDYHWSWMLSFPAIVKDGLLITFDLETLRKDSDGDGLTDIEEARLRTDPFSKDTDNDGILDDLDLNPRCNVPRTDKTIIYEVILDESIRIPFYDREDPLTIPFDEIAESHYCVDTTRTVMIVTDDPDIRSIQPKTRRVIFLSSEEMGDSKYSSGDLERTWFYPLEKQEDGSYEVNVHHSASGETYRIMRTSEGWVIKMSSRYIE